MPDCHARVGGKVSEREREWVWVGKWKQSDCENHVEQSTRKKSCESGIFSALHKHAVLGGREIFMWKIICGRKKLLLEFINIIKESNNGSPINSLALLSVKTKRERWREKKSPVNWLRWRFSEINWSTMNHPVSCNFSLKHKWAFTTTTNPAGKSRKIVFPSLESCFWASKTFSLLPSRGLLVYRVTLCGKQVAEDVFNKSKSKKETRWGSFEIVFSLLKFRVEIELKIPSNTSRECWNFDRRIEHFWGYYHFCVDKTEEHIR